MATKWFTPALFAFLSELDANNSREWFQDNKARFEADVRDPLLAFIMALGEPLGGLNPNFLADPRPSGGSMFRIYRDTRFARDKSPYKTNVGAQFRHGLASRDVHAPGFYLHLDPAGCFASAGLWHPEPVTLKAVRDRIVSNSREWKAIHAGGLDVLGDSLVRVPQGFDAGHPLADDLRLKDFYTHAPLTQRQVCSGNFLGTFAGICEKNLPLMKFLTKAVGLPW
jgi:uncharacterized protein (TIGR02453 family)